MSMNHVSCIKEFLLWLNKIQRYKTGKQITIFTTNEDNNNNGLSYIRLWIPMNLM